MTQQMSIKDWLGQLQATQEALSGPQTRRERQAQGTQSQRAGTALERQVRASLEAAGAWVVQVPPAVQLLGAQASTRLLVPGADGRLLVARLESPVAPDVVGVSRSGLALAIECKSTATEAGTWPLGKRLRGHQGEALRAVEARGGAGAVMLSWGESLHLLPWVDVDPAPRQSLRRAEVEAWRVGPQWAAHLESQEAWLAWRGRHKAGRAG